jgi:hypothetical protein
MALIANLRHYLSPDLKLVKIPAPAAALREFLGCVVEAVTSRDPDDINYVTHLKCLKSSNGCDGNIIACYDQDNSSVIKWSCSSCKECGQLTGWEKTLWDKRSK